MQQNNLGMLIKYVKQFRRNRIPFQLVIQTTNRCNAACPQCGMRKTEQISRFSLSDENIQRILEGCAANKVQALSFTGGEPFLHLDQLIKWINSAGCAGIPFIRTGTNGYLFRGSDRPGFTERVTGLAKRLAATPLRNFWISLDSADPLVHERMRGLPGVVAGIKKALPIFHANGIYPSVNLGINRLVGGSGTAGLKAAAFTSRKEYLEEFYNRYCIALDQFYHAVKAMGFTMVNACYPMNIDSNEKKAGLNAVYAAMATEDIVSFDGDEKAMLFKALLDTIVRHRNHLRIFSPLSSLYVLQRSYAKADSADMAAGCRGGVDFFFIDAKDGDTYPCGFRGNENLGKFWELDVDAIQPGRECRRCDWECFRDPSELCAPLLQAAGSPMQFIRNMAADRGYRRHWIQDMRYYNACEMFDGRRPPDLNRLKSFAI